MEKCLAKHLEDAVGQAGVDGALTIDQCGLPLVCKGSINPNNSGTLAAAVDKAAMLHADKEPPVLVVDLGDGETLLIKQEEFVTTVVKKRI